MSNKKLLNPGGMRFLAALDTKNEACTPSDYFALNE